MKTTIQIKSIFGKLLFEFEKENNTIKDTVEEAVKNGANLSRANLYGANLEEANLSRANLSRASLDGASLYGANLYRANLEEASLYGANLSRANLEEASLYGASLNGANLSRANLEEANLYGANLSRASLDGASLYGANLEEANLDGANLYGANLSRANLYGASLDGANLSRISKLNTIVPEGELIVWKALQNGLIAKLIIPAKAKRVNAIGSRKCRFEYVIVDAIYDGKKKVKQGRGIFNSEFIYEVGKEVRSDDFDPDPRVECSHGIHAFITRLEATEYNQ